MDTEDWKVELQCLFEIFERESTISLRKINRCFGMLGRPFGDEFRQYFLKMSTARLDSCFNAVLMERKNGKQMPMPIPSTSSDQNDSNRIAINSNNQSSANAKVDSRNRRLLGWKTENGVYVPIEIIDSDDDSVDVPQETNGSLNDKEGDADLNVEYNVEIHVKCEPKAEIEEEMVDLPMEVFDPVKENERFSVENCASVAELMDDRIEAKTTVDGQNKAERADDNRFKCKRCEYTANHKGNFQRHQMIHDVIKPFKCGHCDFATRQKTHLTAHQRTHDIQKLMGVVRDPKDGLFNCKHCDQRFTKWTSLKGHLTLSHKNDQRLFNCKRCMRRFTQKSTKDRHEVGCQNRRYECYLCKTYVANVKRDMQDHLRTHSGAKPFECSVCMKFFRSDRNLRRHLNSVHSHTRT